MSTQDQTWGESIVAKLEGFLKTREQRQNHPDQHAKASAELADELDDAMNFAIETLPGNTGP